MIASKSQEERGDVAYKAKSFAMAKSCYYLGLKLDPNNTTCQIKLARILFEEKNYKKALTMIGPLLKDNEKMTEVPMEFYHFIIWTLINCGLFHYAETIYDIFCKAGKVKMGHYFEEMFELYLKSCSEYAKKNWLMAGMHFYKLMAYGCKDANIAGLAGSSYFEIKNYQQALHIAE